MTTTMTLLATLYGVFAITGLLIFACRRKQQERFFSMRVSQDAKLAIHMDASGYDYKIIGQKVTFALRKEAL